MLLFFFRLLHILKRLKPAAHSEKRAEQTAVSSLVRGNFGEKFGLRGHEDKSNMFDIFGLARQIPHYVWPS